MIGYVLYPERFAGTLRDVQERLDYLQELHIRAICRFTLA
jgi:glycosidase